MVDLKLKADVMPNVGAHLIRRRKELIKDLAELERDCFEPALPVPGSAHDKIMAAADKYWEASTAARFRVRAELEAVVKHALGVEANADNTPARKDADGGSNG